MDGGGGTNPVSCRFELCIARGSSLFSVDDSPAEHLRANVILSHCSRTLCVPEEEDGISGGLVGGRAAPQRESVFLIVTHWK